MQAGTSTTADALDVQEECASEQHQSYSHETETPEFYMQLASSSRLARTFGIDEEMARLLHNDRGEAARTRRISAEKP